MPCLPERITLAKSVIFTTVSERDKKRRPVDERRNLKKCEIKQLPNCWPENLSTYPVSPRFPSPPLSFLFLPRHPHLSPGAFVRFPHSHAEPPSRRNHPSQEIHAFSFSVHPQFSVGHDIIYSSTVAFTHAVLSFSFSPPLSSSSFFPPYQLRARFIPERIRFDPIRRRRRLPEANCGIIRRIPFGKMSFCESHFQLDARRV